MSLYQLRKSKHLSGKEVARQMNIHPSYYCHLENGRRKFTPKLIESLANVLDEPVELITDKVRLIGDRASLTRSWLLGIKINGLDVLKAFEYELLMADEPIDIKQDVKERLAQFIRQNIAQSVMAEIDLDTRLYNTIVTKLKHVEDKVKKK